jgi:hypothetical protein
MESVKEGFIGEDEIPLKISDGEYKVLAQKSSIFL